MLRNISQRLRQVQNHSIVRFSTKHMSTLEQENEDLGDLAFHRETLYGSAPEMTYGGALSFLRRKYSKNVFGHGKNKDEKADVVISGICYDGAVTYRYV